MPDPQRVLVHVSYPDDPPVQMVYREDGSVEQVSGRPGIVMGFQRSDSDVPTMLVKIEHGEGWQPVEVAHCGACDRQVTSVTAEECMNCAAILHGEANSRDWREASP